MATPSPHGDGAKTFTLASIMDESDDNLSDVELDAVRIPPSTIMRPALCCASIHLSQCNTFLSFEDQQKHWLTDAHGTSVVKAHDRRSGFACDLITLHPGQASDASC
jgi:hypothetical protein